MGLSAQQYPSLYTEPFKFLLKVREDLDCLVAGAVGGGAKVDVVGAEGGNEGEDGGEPVCGEEMGGIPVVGSNEDAAWVWEGLFGWCLGRFLVGREGNWM